MNIKRVLIGFGAALLGCVVAAIALTIWDARASQQLSFSPMGMVNHLAHSVGFWLFIIVLFGVGLLFSKRLVR